MSKKLRHLTSGTGGKKTVKRSEKVWQTDRQTNTHTDIRTSRLIECIGLRADALKKLSSAQLDWDLETKAPFSSWLIGYRIWRNQRRQKLTAIGSVAKSKEHLDWSKVELPTARIMFPAPTEVHTYLPPIITWMCLLAPDMANYRSGLLT